MKVKTIDVCDVKTYPKELINAFKNNETEKMCFKIIEKEYLICFHYTRLYDKNIIKKEGLVPFNYKTLQYVIDVYYELYNDENECHLIREAVEEHLKRYDIKEVKETWNTKLNKLCFVVGMSNKTKEYSRYYSMFGGECISNATKNYVFHDKLINIGENFCIKFIIPITYLRRFKSGTQISSLIYIMKENYFKNKSEPFDGYLYDIAIEPKFIKSVDKI